MTQNVRSVHEAMEQLYSTREKYGDIVFVVETERIRAHKQVLASASPKYAAQFYGLQPDENEIYLPNVSASAFTEFLQLFYKDTIDLTAANIETVLDLAKQSLVDEFVDTCKRFIKETIIHQNVCEAYRLAILYDLKTLRKYCELKISENTWNVFASDGFLQCDHEMLLQILKLDCFNCTELNVLKACVEWAREACKRQNIDETNMKNLRAALSNAIQYIRFGSMTVEQFVDVNQSLDGFFTPEECMEIVNVIGRLKDFTPKLFSNDRRTQYTSPKDSIQGMSGKSFVHK